MNQDRIATPQLMHKAKQESEEPDISRSTLQHQAGDAPVKTPDCEQVKEPLIKVEKHDPGLIAGLEDQKAATGVNQKPSFEDTEMPFDPEIDLVEPLAKVGKADSDLAASIGEQNSATGAKQEPFCEDAEMTLAAKIDPTESTITYRRTEGATSGKNDPYYEDVDISSAPNIDPNEPTANSNHSDCKRSLTPFDSKDLLEEKRTPGSVESSGTKPQGQLCISCFKEWGMPMKPGGRLLDCQTSHKKSTRCGHCVRRHFTCVLVTPNLIRDLLQLKYEMNNALDVGEATDEKKRFYDAYQNVSGKIA
ncbi:hypothetical protein N7491_003196 [Penicillium cf. griseofulvum]|nr:hypothetical protein N7491_003196 [Penicillium cf. griseofulvum]